MANAKYLKERAKLRKTLVRLLGGFPAKSPLRSRVKKRTEKKDFTVETVTYQSVPGDPIFAHVIKRKDLKGKVPGIVYIHGHTKHEIGKDSIFKRPVNTATALCQAGYVVVCPDSQCFGDRMIPGFDGPSGERLMATNLLLDGKTWAGQQIWDIMRSVDYLQSRKDVDPSRIGSYGMSMGGFESYFTSALEKRIKVAGVSGAMSSFESVIRDKWIVAYDFYIPGIRKYCEVADIYALIAPRPLIITAGRREEGGPMYAVNQICGRTRKAYKTFGASKKLKIVLEDCGHVVTDTMRAEIVKWFQQWLITA